MHELRTTIEEVTDPGEVVRSRQRRERYLKNDAVLRAHIPAVYRQHRGKVVVVAGQELHVADTAEEAWNWAHTQHPDDDGLLVRAIPKEKGWRVYANRG